MYVFINDKVKQLHVAKNIADCPYKKSAFAGKTPLKKGALSHVPMP